MEVSDNSINGRRVASNTIMLYLRMLLVMVVSLYTVRVVLNVLGEEDYGIYNVVGGIVLMFSFLSRTLASASQRYFAFEIGRKDYLKLSKTFDITLTLYVLFVLIIIVFAETIGLWFVNNKMTLPVERIKAVNVIYQFSIVSFCLSILATPYQAIIIAYEKMNIYAFVGVAEALLSLCFAISLSYASCDSLILYGALVMCGSFITNGIYFVYSIRNYPESRYSRFWNSILAKEIISYSGWNMYGAVANVIRSHGINILINVFFNPVINAARGLAYQVNNAVSSFASNFYTAVRPQLTKSYAEGNMQGVNRLVDGSSKFSYYLILIIAAPLMVFAEQVLSIWLVDVPQYTSLFMNLTIIVAMIDAISNPLMTLVQATGKVKGYQLIIGSLLLLNLPISWILLKNGFSAEYTMYVAISLSLLSLYARLLVLGRIISFKIISFIKNTLFRMIISTVACYGTALLIKHLVFNQLPNTFLLLCSVIIIVFVNSIILLFLGFNMEERTWIWHLFFSYFKRK